MSKKKTKIAFLEIKPGLKEYLEPRLRKDFDLFFSKNNLSRQNLKKISEVEILSLSVDSFVNKKTLNSLKQMRYITTRSTGFDHINLASCKRRGVLVSNVPYYAENTVAEHTLALLLALSRNLYPSFKKTKRGDFSLKGLRGFELKGKTIGIIGTGAIGRRVAKIAKGFGMNVLAYDAKQNEKLGVKYVTLDKLFKNSDIISPHIPYNKKTRHLISLKALKKIKKGCYLINTARGGICDTSALLKGLELGVFAGLGLDVLEEERLVKEKGLSAPIYKKLKATRDLIQHPKVIITPHSAFNSQEAFEKILDTTLKNIKAFAKGKPINLVE